MSDLIRRPGSSLGFSSFEEMDNLFGNLWNSFGMRMPRMSAPSLDIYSEDDNMMVLELQAPGFDQKDIQVNVRNGVLEIRGEKKEREETKDRKRSYMVREQSSSFARRVVLPENADADKITAELDRGVLKVMLPIEQPKAKNIEVNVKPQLKETNK